MRGRSRVLSVFVAGSLIALVAVQLAPAAASVVRPPHISKYRAAYERALETRARRAAAPARSSPSAVLENFTVVGHADLGLSDTNADVWVHEDHAYVGTWGDPCNGLGAKIIDISDPADPVMIGRIAGVPGTSTEDVVVRSVSTPSFSGDLLAAGIQRCDFDDPDLDDDTFGVDLWNVTDPANPVHFGHFGLSTGGGGTHELDLFQRGSNVYVLSANPFNEWFDPVNPYDVSIVDVTNPAAPAVVGTWTAGAEGLSPGPFYGQGSFGSMFAHSARASGNGNQAFISYWDLGVVTLDITDVTEPSLVTRTQYAPTDDGEMHSLVPYSAGGRDFLLTNDEDYDPRSPGTIRAGGSDIGTFSESPFARPLYSLPDHELTARTVRPRAQGCKPGNYDGLRVNGRIAVPKTFFTEFDDPPEPEPACSQGKQERIAQRLGAAAVVHDFISDATSPQWWTTGDVGIPAVFTDHQTARDILGRRVTLAAGRPTVGFLRVYDAETGEQVASFDDLPLMHKVHPPGTFTIHNTEVNGDVAYSSWYDHGIVAVDLSPLATDPIGDPILAGRFVPDPVQGAAAPFGGMWGVFVRPSDGLVFASEFASGLWILQPTGAAAP
jgi:hypothetical protein